MQALPRTKQDCLRLVLVYGQTIEMKSHPWMRDTLQVLVYQTDLCVTEQYGVGYHLHTVVAGFQSAYCLAILLIGEVFVYHSRQKGSEFQQPRNSRDLMW